MELSQAPQSDVKTTNLRLKQVKVVIQPVTLQTSTEADVRSASGQVSPSPSKRRKVETASHGQNTLPSGSPDPSKCHISGKGLEVAEVGQKATAIIQVFNSTGEPCNPAKALECKLVSNITGAEVAGSFKKLEGQNRFAN